MILEVAYLPETLRNPGQKTCIVIDVVRASSTMVVMLDQGARSIILADSIAGARQAAASRPGTILCGESGGVAPPGFRYGNSPREYASLDLSGQELVFCTSNGTRALRVVQESPAVLVGSLLNATAVVEKALSYGRDVALVCSGRALGTSFGVDDAYCAGYLTDLIMRQVDLSTEPPPDLDFAQLISTGKPSALGRPGWFVDESAIAALRLLHSYGGDTLAAFGESGNGRGLIQLGLGEDLAFCAQVDVSDTVPILQSDGQLLRVVSAALAMGRPPEG